MICAAANPFFFNHFTCLCLISIFPLTFDDSIRLKRHFPDSSPQKPSILDDCIDMPRKNLGRLRSNFLFIYNPQFFLRLALKLVIRHCKLFAYIEDLILVGDLLGCLLLETRSCTKGFIDVEARKDLMRQAVVFLLCALLLL